MGKKEDMTDKALILIVDDVPRNLQVLGNILRGRDYNIAAAMHGRQALSLLENIQPDLILLDVMMPEMDGFETCKRLKASDKTKDIPVIFLTAMTETEDIVNGFECGAVDYVTKPFNATELLVRVETHIELKNARERLKDLVAKLEMRTEELSKANYQLRERQNVIIKLLGDISRIRLSGDRHAIRNYCQKIHENEKNLVMRTVANHIVTTRELVESPGPEKAFLENACAPFGLEPEMLSDADATENRLHAIVMDKKPDNANIAKDDAVDDFLGGIFSQDIYLDDAYEEFWKARETYIGGGHRIMEKFDPFAIFQSLRSIREIIAEINKRFADKGKIGFLDPVTLSESVRTAQRLAVEEKRHPLECAEDLRYDPEFHTNKDSLVFMMRDLFYNAVDAGADSVRITAMRPSKEEKLPRFDDFAFEEYPSLYIGLEDNGPGISSEKAGQLNAYLAGTTSDESGLSTKGKEKGGLGTKNLRDFLFLHKGHCFYEHSDKGTVIHLYFEKLEV